MFLYSTMILFTAHFISSTHAAILPHAARRDSTAGLSGQSHGLSTEALLTLIGVCVAVLGIALALIQSWPSLKMTWGLCRSQRFHPRSSFRPISACMSPHFALRQA